MNSLFYKKSNSKMKTKMNAQMNAQMNAKIYETESKVVLMAVSALPKDQTFSSKAPLFVLLIGLICSLSFLSPSFGESTLCDSFVKGESKYDKLGTSTQAKYAENNPLLNRKNMPYGTFDFSAIQLEHVLPAFELVKQRIEEKKKSILNSKEEANFENTVLPLNEWDIEARPVVEYTEMIKSNLSSPEVRDLSNKIQTELVDLQMSFFTNKELFERFMLVYNQRSTFEEDQRRLTEDVFRGFRDNGMQLSPEKLEQFKIWSKLLIEKMNKFEENNLVASDIDHFQIQVTDPQQLEGIPENFIHTASVQAKKLNKEGWVFGANTDLRIAVLSYAKSDDLRRRFLAETSKIATVGNEDNTPLVKEIVEIRTKMAAMLGFPSFAHWNLEGRMLSSPQKAIGFGDEMIQRMKPLAQLELQVIQKFKEEKTKDSSPLTESDVAYWKTLYKKEKLSVDVEEFKNYFSVENVLNGLFIHAQKLYGLRFVERKDLPVFSPDVRVYEVFDSSRSQVNQGLGLLYIDLFERPGQKRSGAWANGFQLQGWYDGKAVQPLVLFALNVQPSASGKVSLLTLEQTRTAFHEFGHALHHLLSNVRYLKQSGTNVAWDFVEFPSQWMENFVTERESLDLFAFHYETGKTIPEDMLKKYLEGRFFYEANSFLRQLQLSTIDWSWYYYTPQNLKDLNIAEYENQTIQRTQLVERIDKTRPFTNRFMHIMSGGYSAGYYGYQWTMIIQSHVYSLFKKKGLYDPQLSQGMKKILSSGSTKDPMDMMVQFLGEEPNSDAFFKQFEDQMKTFIP